MTKIEDNIVYMQSEIAVFILVDVSSSMRGSRIAEVNKAMREVPAQLRKINDELLGSHIVVAPMAFSSGAWWLTSDDKPVDPCDFVWRDVQAEGITDMGHAFDLLYDKMTPADNGGWMKGRGGMAPVVILISDGSPTDNYQGSLKRLRTRGWFDVSYKYAVAVGGADKKVLTEFTGLADSVIDTEKLRRDLSSVVQAVVVSASKTASKYGSRTGTKLGANNVVLPSAADTNSEAARYNAAQVNQSLRDVDSRSDSEEIYDGDDDE